MKYSLAEETLGYTTAPDQSNIDKRFLVAGSKNVLVDFQKKARIRPGYTRLGVANPDLTEIRNAWTWNTSTTIDLPQRFYDDELEVYLGTIDTVAINAWTRVKDGWGTTKKLRTATWFDSTEKIDLQIMVQGTTSIHMWNGAVAVVDSVTATTITKKGTTTFAENRFFATGNKTVVCVRTGTEYTYTGGETTTTLTGIASTVDLVSGDILVQKIVTTSPTYPGSVSNYLIDIIFSLENQIIIGSETDERVFFSKNSDYDNFTFSSPRVSGEGGVITLDDPTRAISAIGKLPVVFSGLSSIYKVEFQELEVNNALAETIKVKKLETGIGQGALNHECVVPIGNSLAFLSNEVALRIIEDPENLTGINPKTFSNPIKPDFDAEDWTGAFGTWYKNILIFTAPVNSHMYMLNFVQDADGKLFRFWNPPQVLPVGPMSIIDSGSGPLLHGHSNSIPESYLLFDGQSDGQYADMPTEDKIAIDCKMIFAYNNYGKRAELKTFDEYYVEGEITPNTEDLTLIIGYDFDGITQQIEKTIDGSDEDILEGAIGFNSLAQQSLAVNPLGGLLNPPADARKFRVVFEIAREDFFEIQAVFASNEVDRYFAIIAHGTNATISPRKAINIRK